MFQESIDSLGEEKKRYKTYIKLKKRWAISTIETYLIFWTLNKVYTRTATKQYLLYILQIFHYEVRWRDYWTRESETLERLLYTQIFNLDTILIYRWFWMHDTLATIYTFIYINKVLYYDIFVYIYIIYKSFYFSTGPHSTWREYIFID